MYKKKCTGQNNSAYYDDQNDNVVLQAVENSMLISEDELSLHETGSGNYQTN